MGLSELKMKEMAADLFVYRGWSIEDVAAEFDLDSNHVERWRRKYSWDEKLVDYLNNQKRLKDYLEALKAKLAREAFKTLEIWYKSGPKKSPAWKTIKEQRKRFAEKQNQAESGDPQMARHLGEKPTPLHTANKNQAADRHASSAAARMTGR